MVVTISKKVSTYRYYEKDIWGIAFTFLAPSNPFALYLSVVNYLRSEARMRRHKRYVYSLEEVAPKKKRKYQK